MGGHVRGILAAPLHVVYAEYWLHHVHHPHSHVHTYCNRTIKNVRACRILAIHMEIHVHSTLANIGKKERQSQHVIVLVAKLAGHAKATHTLKRGL